MLIYQQTNIEVDTMYAKGKSGSTTTGNVCKKLDRSQKWFRFIDSRTISTSPELVFGKGYG